MGDPFSVAGGIVSIISLGLQVTQYLFEYYSALKDRETNLSGTVAKLEQLLKVLEIIRTQVEERKTRSDERELLSNILASVQRCEECIEELQEEADKFRESPAQTRRFRAAARATARRITYPLRQSTLQRIEEDIDEILSQLSLAQQSLIQKELGDVRDDVEDTKALLEQVRASQISSEIRQWLNAPDATPNFNLACAHKHPGTGLWFVQGDTFSEWLREPNSFLWLRGFAGCGKSVLCSTTIQRTYQHQRSRPKAGIAFFYFSFSDSGKQSAEAMLRALILQLSSQLKGDPQLPELHRRYSHGTPPYQALIDCLFQIVCQFTDVYLILDALDESPRGSHRDALLQALTDMRAWSDPRLHLLVTSRDEVDIREELDVIPEEVMVMKNDSIDRDIALFVSQHLRQNRRLRKWERYHERIEEMLTVRAKGVFRWVECQLKALASCPRSEDLLEQLLQSLPETLDETYRRMFLNIPSASAPYARRMLTLLCCCKRPLTVLELVDAVAVELDPTPWYNPKRRLEDMSAIQEVCPGFTELNVDPDTEEQTIQIAHFSVQEYLESERLQEHDDVKAFNIKRTNGHAQMAHICLTFVSEPKLAFSAEQYPFVKYAAKHWPDHFLESSTDESVEIRILQFFRGSRCLFMNWVRIWKFMQFRAPYATIIGDMPSWIASLPLYFASYFGLYSILCKLLDQSYPDHVSTGPSTTSTAATLLNQRTGYINLFWGSALSRAAGEGHRDIVQLLLDHGAHADSTSLRLALRNRFEDIAKLLIKHGADVFAADAAALYEASSVGLREMVEYLLDMGVDPDSPSQGHLYGTPLMEAARHGHKDVAKLLFERGAPIGPPRKIRAAVLRSRVGSPIEISQSLLTFLSEEAGDVDAQNTTWESLLLETPKVGDLETVRHLLKTIATVNPQVEMITDVLRAALRSSWAKEIFKMLLEYGDGLESHMGPAILRSALVLGKEDIVRLLIEKRTNFYLRDCPRGLALPMAVKVGSEDFTKLVLAQGAEINSPDQQGQTALSLAAESGHRELVLLLLEHGADINAQDNWRRSPLHLASKEGRKTIAELLIKGGGDINLEDDRGWYPLHYASWNGHLSVAELLLSEGTAPATTENIGRTPLFLAATAGHPVLTQMFLAIKPSLKDQKDRYGLTPLSAAIIKGHTYVVELLMAAKPTDLECRDTLGRNSVWWARRRGYSDIVQILQDECRRRGIFFDEGDSVVYPPYVEDGSRVCDICGLVNGAVMGCSLCNRGDFDICKECFDLGGRCLDDSHVLDPRG